MFRIKIQPSLAPVYNLFSGAITQIFPTLIFLVLFTVSGCFELCVCVLSAENLSDRKVRAEQEVPYGDILILPGPNYGEELLTL